MKGGVPHRPHLGIVNRLALHTQATVYAADANQHHEYAGPHGAMQLGGWEGQLWCFPPDGYSSRMVRKAPIEFNEVLAGRRQ